MNFQKPQKKKKKEFEKDFYNLMNNTVFAKTIGNVQKNRNIKLVYSDKRKNYLVLDLNYYSAICFQEKSIAAEMRKTQVEMNKSVYLEFSMPDVCKVRMYEFCYNFI